MNTKSNNNMNYSEFLNYMNNQEKSNKNADNKCIPLETPIYPTGLAMAYVPFQEVCGYFEPTESLRKGTVFPSLYKPYK